MSDNNYIIYGSEYSPFSVKVRSYFRYKNIPHEWRVRTLDNMSEFQALAKLPLVPLVHNQETGEVLQDSTPIIEKLESRYPKNSITPENGSIAFLSTLIEEYADEWVNKPMFHFRWWREVDQNHVADGLAKTLNPKANADELAKFSAQLKARMVPRLSFVGSNAQNKELIETSFDELLELLEVHLKSRSYLLGGRPSLADFGLFGQLYCCTQQPTTQHKLDAFSHISRWIKRMLDPVDEGGWEDWEELSKSLAPIIKHQVAGLYLPWANLNAKALKAGDETFAVSLKGSEFSQDTVKYAGRSLAALKTKFRAHEGAAKLEQYLIDTGCIQVLASEDW